MDGVLADFDKRATQILGCRPEYFENRYGSKAFWSVLQDTPNFYSSFDMMIDAPFLIDAVKHLVPVVLTGIPLGDWAAPQKREWVRLNLPSVSVITCRSKEKSLYCEPGDVIVDDRTEYRHLWEDKGGIWVHHTSAYESIRELRSLGVID